MGAFLARMTPRRRLLLLRTVPLVFLVIVAIQAYNYSDQLAQIPRMLASQHTGTKPHTGSPERIHDGEIISATNITLYFNAILGREKNSTMDLSCPKFNESRYQQLKKNTEGTGHKLYYFALDLRQNLPLLQQLIGSILEVVRFLGPANCALSIVEGNSNDGTKDVLSALSHEMTTLGLDYTFQTSTIDPSQEDRIGRLASLRNLALEPLLKRPNVFSNETTVIFINDVAICPDDLLELVLQRKNLGADMTCAMDWTYAGQDPTFYDVWVARGMTGDSFFLIPPDGNWDSAWNLFWNDQDSKSRLDKHLPFQVFSCWNGATAFTAHAIFNKIQFRKPVGTECTQGEPQLFCKDLWLNGFGRIAVIPSVNLEYSVEKGRMIKEAKGFTSSNIDESKESEYKITWQQDPPEKVKCMPVYENQYFQPWNEGAVNTTNST